MQEQEQEQDPYLVATKRWLTNAINDINKAIRKDAGSEIGVIDAVATAKQCINEAVNFLVRYADQHGGETCMALRKAASHTDLAIPR